MTFSKKCVILIILVSAAIYNFMLFIMYQPMDLDIYNYIKIEWYENIILFVKNVSFYINISLILILVLSFFIVVFIPIKSKFILNKNKNTKTMIETRAIKSLLLIELDKIEYIEKKNVKISIFKRKQKLKATITGLIVPHYELDVNTEELLSRIISSASLMFGIPEKYIQLKLHLKPKKKGKRIAYVRVK